ncbi:translocase of chloroplast 120, chloroplastic-like [Mercurialis annua]|uniref:translocase of chloroplast 120, chloroplastic-like n=1 Tax=Mercurialis annua TaxID=3986 RepID=UPI00215EBA0B|nr:translocase of chloroplast 120, chloroplastic-like [Mercurialis annua]
MEIENGVERIGGAELGEKNDGEIQVVGRDNEVEDVVERLKDVEEEVFEEAIDSQEQLLKEEDKVESGVSVDNVNDSVSELVDENLNVVSELENFEEASDVDVPVVEGDSGEEVDGGVVAEEEVKDLVGGDSVDKIDEGGTGKEVGSDELNGEKEVLEIDGDEGIEVLKDAVEVDSGHQAELTGEIVPDNGKQELKEDEADTEYQKTTGVTEVLAELEEGKTEGYHENLPKIDAEYEIVKSEKLETGAEYQGVKSEKLETGAKYQGAESEKLEIDDTPVLEAELTREIMSGNRKEVDVPSTEAPGTAIEPLLELKEGKGEDFGENLSKIDAENLGVKSEKLEVDDMPVLDYANGVHESEKQQDNSKSLDVGPEDDSNGDAKKAAVLLDSIHQGESEELISSSAVVHTEEVIDVPQILNSQSETIVNNGNKEPVTREASITLEDNKVAKAEDDKVSEPLHANQLVNGVGKDNIVIDEPKKEAEVKKEKHNQGNGERTISPPVKLVSSSERSTGSAPSPVRPAGLGRAAPLLEPAPRAAQQQQQQRVNGAMSNVHSQQIDDPEIDEYDETREKLQMIRVKFLRLAHRLGQTPHNVVVAQVLYRLGLAEQLRGRNGGRVGAFSFDRASAMAEQLEAAGQEPLDFSCTIMVLGKTGVGKSATINSLFDEVKFGTDAFQLGTKKVQDVVGTVQGIKVRVIDTPGLLPSGSDQRQNEKILQSVKCFTKRTPPDIVLYLDRLDMQSRDFGDMPLLRTITDIFGPSIWFNAIVVLTHAASAPPDGPNGTASSYDMFVTQRSHVVQQAIRQAAGDMRLMNPVSLVENHSACRTNRAGQRVLPNGQVWKPHLLLLSFASKILAEANTLLMLQDSPPGKPFATRSRAPPLPFLLSSLLQSRPQLKLPEEQFGDDDDALDDDEESSDSEDESEYEELPPFRSLTKAQVAKLSRAQRRAYFDELEYREKLFMKKQLKEEKRRRKMMKKLAAAAKDMPSVPSDYNENVEEESGGAASVPVPMPDLALPASFDSDNPTHRYRYLDSSNQWLVRPVLETHGWDHDVGYEGINVERLFVVKDRIPVSFSSQITKDKKDANVQMELASSVKHGEGKSTSLGFDMQTVGKDMAYTLRSETRFCNFRKNKATAGLSVTLLGDALSAGLKVEDKLIATRRFRMVLSGGAMTGRGDVAYGGSLEAQLRDKDYPLGRALSTLGLSVMDWHGDLALGCNIQSQIPIGRTTNLIARGNLNNRGAGQISIRVNSSEQLQIALIGLLPLLKKLFSYPQQWQS